MISQVSRFQYSAKNILLKWDKIDIFAMRGERKPFGYWKLMIERQNEIKVLHDGDFKKRFCLLYVAFIECRREFL